MDSDFVLWRHSDRKYYLLVLLLTVILASIVALFTYVFSINVVDGVSMLDTLHDGDRVLVTRGYSAPRRGDIVSFRVLEDGVKKEIYIKRVVALPGDKVKIVGDIAYVNGEISSVAPTAIVGTSTDTIPTFVVPNDTFYVLGDNRPEALDSRMMGPIPAGSVIGKAEIIVLPLARFRRIDEGAATTR